MSLHADELLIDEALVEALVAGQFPEYAGCPVRRLGASGSSNALFRLGSDLLVRLPRQPGGSTSILTEARWLPSVAGALPVAVPEFVAVGAPSRDYPEHWAVVRWVDGEHPAAAADAGGDRAALAGDLAAVVRALRELPVPPEAFEDDGLRWYRGGPLTAIDADIRAYAEQCRALADLNLDVDAVLRAWDEAMTAAAERRQPAAHWLHGDLLAENLLLREGRLSAVLDFGGLGVGDPTVDLVAAWEVLDPAARAAFRAEVGVDDRTWALGRAWALAIAVMTFPYYWDTMPERCASRLDLVHQVLADVESS